MALQRRLKEYDAFNIRISKEIHKELQLLKVDTQISKGLLIEMALYDLLKSMEELRNITLTSGLKSHEYSTYSIRFSQISESALENEIYNAMLRKFVGRLPDSVYLSKYDLSQKLVVLPLTGKTFSAFPQYHKRLRLNATKRFSPQDLKPSKDYPKQITFPQKFKV